MAYLDAVGLTQDYKPEALKPIEDAQILAVHSPQHLDFLKASQPAHEIVPLDPDTWMSNLK